MYGFWGEVDALEERLASSFQIWRNTTLKTCRSIAKYCEYGVREHRNRVACEEAPEGPQRLSENDGSARNKLSDAHKNQTAAVLVLAATHAVAAQFTNNIHHLPVGGENGSTDIRVLLFLL